MDAGVWIVKVFAREEPSRTLLTAGVQLDMPFVGPWITDWHGRDYDRGLNILVEVLRIAFGNCPGLELSEWKLAQSSVDRAATGFLGADIVPSEFDVIDWLEPDRGLGDRRGAVVASKQAPGEGPFVSLLLGPLPELEEFLRCRSEFTDAENGEMDRSLLSELQRVVRNYTDGVIESPGESSRADASVIC